MNKIQFIDTMMSLKLWSKQSLYYHKIEFYEKTNFLLESAMKVLKVIGFCTFSERWRWQIFLLDMTVFIAIMVFFVLGKLCEIPRCFHFIPNRKHEIHAKRFCYCFWQSDISKEYAGVWFIGWFCSWIKQGIYSFDWKFSYKPTPFWSADKSCP